MAKGLDMCDLVWAALAVLYVTGHWEPSTLWGSVMIAYLVLWNLGQIAEAFRRTQDRNLWRATQWTSPTKR